MEWLHWIWRQHPWIVPRPQMGSGGPRSSVAGHPGGGGDDVARSRDGGYVTSLLQQGCRSFTCPSRAGRAWWGLVCSRCYVRPMTASRRWSGFLQRGYCFLPRLCHVPLLFRLQAMLRSAWWWRLQDRGGACWWVTKLGAGAPGS
jgi:hypothetical protein